MKRQSKSAFVYSTGFAIDYISYDFGETYEYFVKELTSLHGTPSGKVIDLCCGTGNILKLLKQQFPSIDAYGCDIAPAMIDCADDDTEITYTCSSIHDLEGKFDMIVCNNAYHHFDEPVLFWNTVERLSTETTKIFVSDVVRPATEDDLHNIVQEVLGDSSPFHEAFTLSLVSSYTEDELIEHAKQLGLTVDIINTPINNYKLFVIHN